MSEKYVYLFKEGNADMREILGGKGANLAEMTNLGLPIPQGFTVVEDSLMLLQTKGIIEKYEISYTDVNIYLRNFEVNQIIDLSVNFRASYPVEITGLAIRAYDYYNPEIEGKAMPIEIKVNE